MSDDRKYKIIHRISVINISLFLITIFFALLVSEFILRLYLPQPGFTPNSFRHPKGLWLKDKNTGFRYASNYSGRFTRQDFDTSIFTDSLGNRIGKVNRKPKKHDYNIIAVGDSLTFGWGVEANEAWPYSLSVKLNTFQLSGRNVGVSNLGVSSFNINQMILRAKQVISVKKPDMLILGFYAGGIDRIFNPYYLIAGNHIREKQLPFVKLYKDGLLSSEMSCPQSISLDFWLSEHFYIGALAWKVVGKYFEKLVKCNSVKEQNKVTDWEQKQEAVLSNVVTTSLKISKYLASENIEFVMLLMVTQELDGKTSKRQKYIITKLDRQLTEYGINVFDTTHLIESTESPVQQFRFKSDGHWNKKAHKLVAFELAKYIRNKNLIK